MKGTVTRDLDPEKVYKEIDFAKQLRVIDEFPVNQYMREVHPKNQIYLHHTVSGAGAAGDIRWWIMTEDRIATSQIVDHEGLSNQLFSSKYWAHHLGIRSEVFRDRGLKPINKKLNQESIGIEIDSLGPLIEHSGCWYMSKWDREEGKFIPNMKVLVPEDRITFYPNGFRGFEAYESYTDEQIETTAGLLILWHNRYGIPLTYRPDHMWDMSNDALRGVPGVYSHCSVRPPSEKQDAHPMPSLIRMLEWVGARYC